MQWLLDATGQSVDAQARGDMADFDRTTGKLKRQWYERPFDYLLGRSEEDLNEAAQQRRTSDLRKGYGEILQGMDVPGVNTEVTYRDSQKTIDKRQREAEELIEARQIARANEVPEELVKATTDIGTLSALTREHDPDKKEADRRYYDDRASERADRQLQREMMMLQSDRDYDLKKLELNQGNARRKAELFQTLFGLGRAFMI